MYIDNKSFHSHIYLVVIKSTINQKKAHSATIQKGDHQSKAVLIINIVRLSYINNAKTKFIHAHNHNHLIQNEILNENKGYSVQIPNIQIKAQRLIYHNKIAQLSNKLASEKNNGIIKNPPSQKIKPTNFHKAILFINFDSNNFIIFLL